MHRLHSRYKHFFSIGEIERSVALQWTFGALLFFFFLAFSRWIGHRHITLEAAQSGSAVCWPFFQSCADFYFLSALPEAYSQTILYMGFYALMLAIVYAMWRNAWAVAHVMLSVLLAWEVFVVSVNYLTAAPYYYYHIALTAVFLFVPYKEYFLKLVFVVLYFLSGTIKFDETWVLGTYFTSLQTGLPLFPDALTPLFTNLVIFMEVVGAWFLLSKNLILQRSVLFFFIAFHLYSGILVNYVYPSVSLPILIILFGMYYRHERPPFSRASIAGWAIIVLLFLFQIPPLLIEGDRRLTLEGNRYGMFMFEANHQCITTVRAYERTDEPISARATTNANCGGQTCLTEVRTYEEDGLLVEESRYETGAAWNRCDPYVWWTRFNSRCRLDPSVVRIALQFDHSINGGPFYRIVDEENICELSYEPFSHNAWIKLPPEAPIIGIPIKDEYRY